MNERKLTRMMHEIIVDRPGEPGVSDVAAMLGKRPPTIYGELNPFGGPGKLGLDDAHRIIVRWGLKDPVQAMAADLGYRLVAMELPEDIEELSRGDVSLRVMQSVVECLTVFREGGDPTKHAESFAEAFRELDALWHICVQCNNATDSAKAAMASRAVERVSFLRRLRMACRAWWAIVRG